MPWIDSLDWTSLNALRRYPLREGCSALSTDETFSIPDNLIVDFTLCATSEVSARFYISKIFNKITTVDIEISDYSGIILGTVQIVGTSHTENKDYYLNPTTQYVGANGKITIGSLDALAYQPAGVFEFSPSATEFEPRTIIPGLQGIDRIVFIDSHNGQNGLTGNVTLTSRNNMRFSYSADKVFLDAGDNLGLNKECAVTASVKSINGVVPDPLTGDIAILGVNCLRIYSSAQYTIDMEDTCCTPCSGCNDLEELTGRLTSLENKFLSLKDGYNNVNSQLTNYLSTINSNCACPS
jgi:hypothetical protein